MMKSVAALSCATVLCSVILGCGDDSKEDASSKSIGFVTGRPVSADPFFASLMNGAKSKAKALGVDLLVEPSPDWNPTAQTPVVEHLMTEKVGAIVIEPTSSSTADMIAPLKKAHDAGIKIITIDTFIGDNTYGKGGPADFPIAYIGSNNAEGGKIGCAGLAEAVAGTTGKVIVIGDGCVGSTSVVDRTKGCLDELAANHPEVQVLNDPLAATGATAECQATGQSAHDWSAALTTKYLASTPDLAGVFTTSGDTSAGGTDALVGNTTVKLFIFDCSPAAAQNIIDKTLYACVAQKPALMGATGVEFAHNAINGVADLPTYVSTGFVLLNQENISDAEKAQFVYGSKL